ncbi:hypothetical protein PVAG01_00423 [Phlyctema vagabunda]|uniref:Uncharacterized protein n=1 Tax=Phlyctema vagabunda TaxID=108571 RepID=A0ABR4PU76_9HELO
MRVPKMSQLHSGVRVNIVLKKDQPTGRLTTGAIADILTRGDHPRGIKVRLQSGDIGRVQSLLSGNISDSHQESLQTHVPSSSIVSSVTAQSQQTARVSNPRYKLQDDYRLDPVPRETVSLEDYIKPSRKKGKGKKVKGNDGAEQTAQQPEQLQAQLELEYPNLDSALIAAILVDVQSLAEAREILNSLS